jgi:hypothetical protein
LKYTLSGATAATGSGSVAGISLNGGITKITYSLLAAQTDACSFNVTVKDNEAPKINIATPTVVMDNFCNFPSVLPSAPTTSDNCTGPAPTLTILSDVTADFSSSCLSKTAALKYTKQLIRTWSAKDAVGNTATRTQTYYLRDMLAPMAVCTPYMEFAFNSSTSLTFPAFIFNNGSSDACMGALSYKACNGAACTNYSTNITLSKTMIPAGANVAMVQVVLRVFDGCGNASNCIANVLLKRTSTSTLGKNDTPTEAIPAETSEVVTDNTPAIPSEVNTTHGDLKCFPNPFTDDLNLQYNLTTEVENVVLKVYDNQGRVVAKNEQGSSAAGYYQMRWNLSDLAPAMYHICLEIDGKCVKTERVIMMK